MFKQIEINGEKWNYLIYDDGRVYSLKMNKFLSPDFSSGYARYLLCKDKKHKRMTAHMLVGLHFIPNPNHLPIIHHKDNDRTNNKIENLEWISRSNNVKKENCKKYDKIVNVYTQEELKNEEWRPFRDGEYEVSSLGRLKNVFTGKILEGHINPILGYIRDTLIFKDKTRKIITRHHIVYEAFHPTETIQVINHIDGIRYNNRLNNLENVSQSENTKKAYIETFKKKTRKCRMKNLITHEEKRFFSIVDASKYIGCSEVIIRMAINRKKEAFNCIWEEITEEEYNLMEGSETIVRVKQ